MYWNMKEFDIAYEKAALVLKHLSYKKDEFVPTAAIMDVVEKLLGIDVKFTDYDFNEFNNGQDKSVNYDGFGAAMCVGNIDGKDTAIILLNELETPAMKRFSLVHELGHLMTQPQLFDTKDCGYTVSTHIDMDITSISEDILRQEDNKFLIDEQVANIFALLVLIPKDLFWGALRKYDSFEEAAKFLGVEKNALISRMLLKDVKEVSNGR